MVRVAGTGRRCTHAPVLCHRPTGPLPPHHDFQQPLPHLFTKQLTQFYLLLFCDCSVNRIRAFSNAAEAPVRPWLRRVLMCSSRVSSTLIRRQFGPAIEDPDGMPNTSHLSTPVMLRIQGLVSETSRGDTPTSFAASPWVIFRKFAEFSPDDRGLPGVEYLDMR